MTEVRLGDKRIPFIYRGDDLLYPNPVKDGLDIWYDFSAMANNDVSKRIAKDLSNNGHDGELQNFGYTDGSGYVGNGLRFDYVDDVVDMQSFVNDILSTATGATVSFVLESFSDENNQYLMHSGNLIIRKNYGVLNAALRTSADVLRNVYSSGFPIEIHKTQAWTIVCHTDRYTIYLNGAEIAGETYSNDETLNLSYPTSASNNIAYGGDYDGTMHSFKLYSRPLTTEEVQHNYRLDKERFGI